MKKKLETINLFGEEGIAIGLTSEYDICQLDDPEIAVRVVGHKIYAASAEEAGRSIRDAFMDRIGMVHHPYHGWVSKDDLATKDL